MDFKTYNKLKKKSDSKDFEGKNKGLDRWLYVFSFLGNGGSIFFAFFLIYPSLFKTISLHSSNNLMLSNIISIILSILILSIFEIIKRYLIKNFSNDFVENNMKIKSSIVGWFTITILLISLSFYFSITGSKNLATTSIMVNAKVENIYDIKRDSIKQEFDNKKILYTNRNTKLQSINDSLNSEKSQIPDNYYSRKVSIQKIIDRNENEIKSNMDLYREIDIELKKELDDFENKNETIKENNSSSDNQNIFLFVVIVIFIELLIIAGIYFREYYEHNLYINNRSKFDKLFLKKERYYSLLQYIYNNGKVNVGDRVLGAIKIVELLSTNSKIQNTKKFVEEFLRDMDNNNVFNVVGKKRYIVATYEEAKNIVNNFDESLQILENIK